MADKIVPKVRADEPEEPEEEELVDPQKTLREQCHENNGDCKKFWGKYQECNDRVNSRSKTAETCEEELIDYIHVLDKCVNKDIFKFLK